MAIAIGGNTINKAYLGTTEIQKMYLGADLVFDNSAPPLSLKPIMTNFRVNQATPTHIHFDEPLGPATGLTTQGFTVSGKAVTNINTLIGYIEVDTPFTFWDNNTIRLEGGNGVVYDFTMEHISNDITQPTAGVDRFVTVSGSGNGEDIGTPASLDFACTNASEGQTWHIQKGDYGSGEFTVLNNGSVDLPIVFKGYNVTPGDLDEDYLVDTYTYGDGYNTAKWPVLVGNNPASINYGFDLNNRQFVIIKNIQSVRHYYNFTSVTSGYNIVYDNCLGGEASANGDLGYAFFSGTGTSFSNIRTNKCIGYDCSSANIRLYGEFNAVLYCKVYTGVASNSDYLVNNYNSSNTIVKGCEGHMIDALGSIGHGFGIKNQTTGNISEYSLFSDNVLYIDQGESFFLAHQGTSNCVMKRNVTYGQTNLAQEVTGYRTRAGAHDNVIEQNYIQYADSGLQIGNNSEDKPLVSGFVSDNNIFRNNIGKDVRYAISVSARQATERYTLRDTHFYNNTFYNIGTGIFEFYATDSFDDFIVENMTAQNNIFYGDGGVTEYAGNYSRTVGQTYNNYWNTGISTPSGTGNQSVNPVFNNTNQGGFQPQAVFDTMDAPLLAGIEYDTYGSERGLNGNTAMGCVANASEGDGSVTPPGDFEIISYILSEETAISIKVQTYVTKQCSINFYVDGVKNAASSDDFNAGYIGPDEYRHTRTLTGIDLTVQRTLVIEVTAEEDLEVVQSGDISLPVSGGGNLTDSLVAYWRFNNDIADQVGGYTGTGTGLSFEAGKSGESLRVSGASGAGAIVPNESSFSFGNGTADQPFSISCYIKFDVVNSATDGWIFTKRQDESGPNTEYQFGVIGAGLFLGLYDQGTGNQMYKLYNIDGNLVSDQWYHLIATYDGLGLASGINLYIDNGASIGTPTEYPSYVAMNATASDVEIGRVGFSEQNALTGNIDGLGLWDIELDAAQRTEIYDIQAAGNELL